jgi:hypothetical protein
MIRTGEFNKARKLLSGLKSDHYVGGVAEAYCRVLDEYPDGTYSGMPISQPDVLWRASTAVALHEMSSMREKMSDLPGLGELRRDELTLESKEMRQLFASSTKSKLSWTSSTVWKSASPRAASSTSSNWPSGRAWP